MVFFFHLWSSELKCKITKCSVVAFHYWHIWRQIGNWSHRESISALSFQETGEINAAFDSAVRDQFHCFCIHPRASEDWTAACFWLDSGIISGMMSAFEEETLLGDGVYKNLCESSTILKGNSTNFTRESVFAALGVYYSNDVTKLYCGSCRHQVLKSSTSTRFVTAT